MVRTKSLVWKYFDKIDSDTVVCRLCHKNFRFSSNTSNMKFHLKSKHSDIVTEYDENEDSISVKTISDTEGNVEMPSTSASVGIPGSRENLSKTSEEKQVLTYQKLVVPMSMRSVYWKCYGFPATADGVILTRVKIVCLLCKNVIAYNRNTSNLRMHLQNKHTEELIQLELTAPPRKHRVPTPLKSNRKKKEIGNIYSTNVDGSVILDNDNSIVTNENVTVTTIEDFEGAIELNEGQRTRNLKVLYNNRANQNNTSSPPGKPHVTLVLPQDDQNCTIESLHPFMIPIESKNVCDAIAEFVVMDMQLPDIVEGRGFQRLIATLKSPCEIPSKTKLVDEVIPRVYENYKDSVQETIKLITSEVSLIAEEWDTVGGETYITFSICYQQERDDNLTTKVLSTIQCPVTVDGSFWSVTFDNILEEWDIKLDKVKAVVCGSCRPEIVDTIMDKGLIVLPCLVQTLQEVCTRVCFEQDDVREILSKCRLLIYLIYKSNNALTSLRIQDHLMSLDETPLVSDYPRVWISTYMMLEGLLVRKQTVSNILDNIEPNTFEKEMVVFSEHDWALIEDVLSVLEPFKVTMMTLSEEKSPLVSLLKPLLWQLISCHLKVKSEDSMNAQVFKAALKNLLSEKYNEPCVNQLLQIATTLDPRFKNLPNMVEQSQSTLEGPIKEALTVVIEQHYEETKPIEMPSEKKKPRLSGMIMLLGEMSTTSTAMSCQDRANLEIVQYQSEPTATLDQCPVVWWSRASTKCPNLARLASQYTCIPASAIPSSRISLESQISYEIKRANLSPEIVDRLIFLNSNHSV